MTLELCKLSSIKIYFLSIFRRVKTGKETEIFVSQSLFYIILKIEDQSLVVSYFGILLG